MLCEVLKYDNDAVLTRHINAVRRNLKKADQCVPN
jgi:hypothetical protein